MVGSAERLEEVVVVGDDDRRRVEAGEDPAEVVVGDLTAGDAAEEDVDAPVAHLVVEQVGRALVVDGRPGDLEVDAPDLAAAVGLRGHALEVLAGDLTSVRHLEPEHQLRVDAGDEGDRERSDLDRSVTLHRDGLAGEAVQAHEVSRGGAAVDRGAVARRDAGCVEGVVEVRVAEEDGVGSWDVAVEQRGVRRPDPAAEQVADGSPGHVGVDEDRRPVVGDREAGDAQPLHVDAGRQAEIGGVDRELGEHVAIGAVVALAGGRVGEQVAEVGERGGHDAPSFPVGPERSSRPARTMARNASARSSTSSTTPATARSA